MSTHYSDAQKPKQLRAWSIKNAGFLISHWRKTEKVAVLAYRGMSGISSATALTMALDAKRTKMPYIMVYVRKENEDSHGHPIEYAYVNCEL